MTPRDVRRGAVVAGRAGAPSFQAVVRQVGDVPVYSLRADRRIGKGAALRGPAAGDDRQERRRERHAAAEVDEHGVNERGSE